MKSSSMWRRAALKLAESLNAHAFTDTPADLVAKAVQEVEREAAEFQGPKWKTIDGEEIPIPFLDDGHLLNIISMLKKRALAILLRETILEAQRYAKACAEIDMSSGDDERSFGPDDGALSAIAAESQEKLKWYNLDERLTPLLAEAYQRQLDLSSFGPLPGTTTFKSGE